MPFSVQAYLDDHQLSVTTEIAKEAFAKAVKRQVAERLSDVTISDGNKSYTVFEFASVMALRQIADTVDADVAPDGSTVTFHSWQRAGPRKYVEWMSRGRRTDRVAYVLKEWDSPAPLPGAEWQRDVKFNPAEEVLANPDLREVFKQVLARGAALIIQKPLAP